MLKRIGLCLFIAFASGWLVGQTAQLSGHVQDQSGAFIPGATIELRNQDSGIRTQTTTNRDGLYSFPVLMPGSYVATVQAHGFPTLTSSTIGLNVAERASMDFELLVRGVREVVEVTVEPSLLQTDSTTLGRVVGEKEIRQLPLATRNFTQLLALSPGVSAQLNDASLLGRGTQNISAGGARMVSNSVEFDGVDVLNIHTNSFSENLLSSNGILVPSPETIQEFKVQTGLYEAAYGRSGGANINLVTKSGGAAFHGSVFEFFRNEALNANDFFFNRNHVTRPVMRQNQFGGTLGGPVVRGRTFFFVAYQGTRQLNGVFGSTTLTLPQMPLDRSPQALGSAFGGLSGVRGGVAVAPDGSNISPVAVALLNYRLSNGQYLIPSPQGSQATGNYSVSIPARFTEDQGTLNLDHILSPAHRISIRAMISNQPQYSPFPIANVPGFGTVQDFSGYTLAVTDTHSFGSGLVNEARLGFVTIKGSMIPDSEVPLSEVGISRFNSSIFPDLPKIVVNGAFTLGYSVDADQAGTQRTVQFSDTLSKVAGRHIVKVGAELRHYLDDYYDNNRARGVITFSSFPDFLLGKAAGPIADGGNGTSFSNIANSSIASGNITRSDRITDVAAFVQDDWKLLPKLTFNAGLRWEFIGQAVDRGGRDGNFLIADYVPPVPGGLTSAGFVQSANSRTLLPGMPTMNPRILNHELWKNFAPRLGFSYQFEPRVVIRGGYGVFFDRYSNQLGLRAALSPPNYIRSFLSGTTNASATFENPFPVLPLPAQFPVQPVLFAPPFTADRPALAMNAIDPNLAAPYYQQYGLNLQCELPGSALVEIGYVGGKGTHLPSQTVISQALLASPGQPVNGVLTNTVENTSLRVPYLGFSPSGLTYLETNTNSNYNSLQVSATHHMAHHLQFMAAYTFSRSIDENSGDTVQSFSTVSGDQRNIRQARGLSDFDRTHRFVASYVFDVPGWRWLEQRGAFLSALFGNWQISGVTVIQSGAPFSITDATGAALYGSNTSRGSFARGATLDTARKTGDIESRLTDYFNTAAFTTAGAYFGNTGRNLLRGPAQTNTDLALMKSFRFGEQKRIEWRTEFFNIFNHPNFANPNSAVNVISTFGAITSTTGNPREIQLALKFLF